MKDLLAKHSAETIFGLFTAIFTGVWARYKARSRKIDNLERGMQALLRDRLTENYYACHEKGYCPLYLLESSEAMYAEYHALGGNGKVKVMMDEIRNMPHIKLSETVQEG